MPSDLIHIDIPEDDGWRDDVAGRLLLALLGGLVLRLSVRLWPLVEHPETGVTAGAVVFAVTAVGVQLLVLSVGDIDLERHGRQIAGATVAILTAGVAATAIATADAPVWLPKLNTDVLAFSSYSVELLVAGQNPYAASMEPAQALPGAGDYWTQRVDGSTVESLSYPAGHVLAFAPQFILVERGLGGLRTTTILLTGGLGSLLVWLLPARLAAAGPLSLLIVRNQWVTAAGGVADVLWVLPVVAAMWAWASGRQLLAAAVLGVAVATKQQSWFVLPALAISVWHHADGWREFVVAGARLNLVGGAVFGAINLPFILWDARAWATGVLTPLGSGGAPLQSIGVGLAAIQQSASGTPIPRVAFTVAVASAAVLWYGWLAANIERWEWAGWLSSGVILLWHSRSLISYMTWLVPVAVVGVVAAQGRLRGQSTAATVSSTHRVPTAPD